MKCVLLLLVLVGCTQVVQPAADAGRLPGDGVAVGSDGSFDGNPDAAPICSTRYRGCGVDADTCNRGCNGCTALGIYPADADLQEAGLAAQIDNTPAMCVDEDPSPCLVLGFVNCFQPGRVCASFGEDLPQSTCLAVDDCLEFQRRALPTLPTGERLPPCLYSDETPVRTGRPGPAVCVAALTTCGTGCPSCGADQYCMYQSEAYPTGICATGTSAVGGSIPCHLANPRLACPTDWGCLLPVRHDVYVSDTQRYGICIPSASCDVFAEQFSDGYRCDHTISE